MITRSISNNPKMHLKTDAIKLSCLKSELSFIVSLRGQEQGKSLSVGLVDKEGFRQDFHKSDNFVHLRCRFIKNNATKL